MKYIKVLLSNNKSRRDGGIRSDILSLDFHIRERRLGIYDPVEEQWLQTPAETAEARAAEQAARAEQEVITRQKAEEEVKRLREQLARAQTDT